MTNPSDMIELDERSGAYADATGAPAPSIEAPQDRSHAPAARMFAPKRTAPRRWRRWSLFLLLPIALLAGGYGYITGGRTMVIDDAYVEADKVGISNDVSGFVKDVDVSENQHVEAGQVLFRLDDLPFRLALARADAQVGTVGDDLNALKADYRDMQGQIRRAENDVGYFSTESGRQQQQTAHVASASNDEAARRSRESAEQRSASLAQQLAAIAAKLHGNPAGPLERNPRYLEAVAQRDEAARQLAHTVVRAPFAGIVIAVPSVAPGKYLQTSTVAFYLVQADHVWVDANPKETDLAHLRPGQPATVKVDAYPDAQWRGTVGSVSPVAAQELSLLPAQNSSGNWVKIVQRIPIRVRVDTRDKILPLLRAGMSAEVSVDTGHARGLPHGLSVWLGQTWPGQ